MYKSDIRNDIITDSNPNIMEYLIQKLESRKKNLFKCYNIFNTIDSFESFYNMKKDILNLFNLLEEELNQASLAIKALVTQNKALSHEIAGTKNLQINYNKLLQENNYLLIENNNLSNVIKGMDTNLNFNNVRNIKPYNSTCFNHKINKKYKPYSANKNKKIQNEKNLTSRKYIGKQNNKVKKTNNNKSKQLNNVKNIINDMKNNKNKVKNIINDYFGRSYTQNNL